MQDREKVISEFERCIDSFSPTDTSDEHFKYVCERALKLLKEHDGLAKAVDQEHRVNEYLNKQLADRPEIVRCKDCKRYYANGGTCDQVLADWFCADGKRRGDDDDE